MARKKDQHAGATPALAALDAGGIAYEVLTYEHDNRSELGFGLEGAAKLGVDPEQVLKTLMVGEGRDAGVCVIPASRRLDLKAAAHALGLKKVALLAPADAERITGYVVGGISPLGQKRRLPTVVDASARERPRILVSGGRRGMSVALSGEDLARACGARFAALTS